MLNNTRLTGIVIVLCLTISSCVTSKKVDELLAQANATTSMVRDSLQAAIEQRDTLNIKLIKAQGGNELLLIAHSQLQEKLLKQDNEITQLNGSLNNTQNNLQEQLKASKKKQSELLEQRNSLQKKYQQTISNYNDRLVAVSDYLALDSLLRAQTQLRSRTGSVSVIIPTTTLFRPGSNTKTQSNTLNLLSPLAEVLNKHPLLNLTIIGHTDNKQANSRAFSAKQAVTLADLMSKQLYIDGNRILAAGMGDTEPIKSNASSEGRDANKRIEFRFNNNTVSFLRELSKIGQE